MTIAESVKLIGTTINYEHKDITFTMRILDVKKSYGKIRFLIEPVAGTGSFWAEKISVSTPE